MSAIAVLPAPMRPSSEPAGVLGDPQPGESFDAALDGAAKASKAPAPTTRVAFEGAGAEMPAATEGTPAEGGDPLDGLAPDGTLSPWAPPDGVAAVAAVVTPAVAAVVTPAVLSTSPEAAGDRVAGRAAPPDAAERPQEGEPGPVGAPAPRVPEEPGRAMPRSAAPPPAGANPCLEPESEAEPAAVDQAAPAIRATPTVRVDRAPAPLSTAAITRASTPPPESRTGGAPEPTPPNELPAADPAATAPASLVPPPGAAPAEPIDPAIAEVAVTGGAGFEPAAERMLDRVVARLRDRAPIDGAPALESRIRDVDLGPIRLLVSGNGGGRIAAELTVTDAAVARALEAAAERVKASGHDLDGIDLRIGLVVAPGPDGAAIDGREHGPGREEPVFPGPAGGRAGAEGDAGRPHGRHSDPEFQPEASPQRRRAAPHAGAARPALAPPPRPLVAHRHDLDIHA